jgi:ribosome biogenesis SPOUT family RNA methylase Rps3
VYEQFSVEGASDTAKTILKRLNLEDVDVPRNMAILAAYAILLQIMFMFILYKFYTGRR